MKKLIVLLLIFVIAFSHVACDEAEETTDGVAKIELWATDSTVKILQDKDYDATYRKALGYHVKGSKGEYESAQIIISALSDVKSYQLKVSDLTNENGDKLLKANFEVLNQKYINVTYSKDIGIGNYPDALLPIDVAKAYGENKITAGDNQGIWITTFIPFDQIEGVYSGSFLLSVQGKEYNVPVSVEVWDFQISKVTHSITDFQNQSYYIIFGELDNSQRMMDLYSEAHVNFRLSPISLMAYGLQQYNTSQRGETGYYQDYIDKIRRFTDLENPDLTATLSTIVLPVTREGNGINRTTFFRHIEELTKASVEDNYNYLALAKVRSGFIDEPHQNKTYDLANSIIRDFNSARVEIAERILNDNSIESPIKDEIVESIKNINSYVTTYKDEELLVDVTNYCVPDSYVLTAEQRDLYADGDHWWYTCGSNPIGYHLDTYLLRSRLASWMQFNYGFTGDLYWQTTLYSKKIWDSNARANLDVAIDPYQEAARSADDNGDGYLFYPGATYGIDGPIASIRAHSIRDSKEEYEFLYYLDKLYTNAGYSSAYITEKLFNRLYSDVNVNTDINVFAQVRESLAQLIMFAEKGVFITQINQQGADMLAQIESTGTFNIIGVNEQAITATKSYTATTSLNNHENYMSIMLSDNTSLKIYLGKKLNVIEAFENNISKLSVESGNASLVQSDEESYAKIEFTAIANKYIFKYSVNSSQVNKNLERISLNMYNPESSKVFLKVYFEGSLGMTFVKDFKLTQGWNDLSVLQIFDAKWQLVGNISNIRMELITTDQLKIQYVYIDNIGTEVK